MTAGDGGQSVSGQRERTEHHREGGSTPVRCRGCKRPWPCPDAGLVPLNPYSRYICPNGSGRGHSTLWTGALNPATRGTRDGYCACGVLLVEEVDDGTRWRVEFEADTGRGWHRIVNETSSESLARSQVRGLREQEAAGEPVRFLGLSRARSEWEAIEAAQWPPARIVWPVEYARAEGFAPDLEAEQ